MAEEEGEEMIVCGNFAKDGQCGTCENFILWGVCSGICGENGADKMAEDKCDCGKYKKGKPITD
jgi:hypothetical protein